MDVFLSWSGEKSKAAALAFRDWLPNLIPTVEPWVSSTDIDAGRRWPHELQLKLENDHFGVLFVTQANKTAPWLTYEAGCLSKSIDSGFVCPILLDLDPNEIGQSNPLSLFQSKLPGSNGVFDVIKSINKSNGSAIDEHRLEIIFNKWWPDLEAKWSNLPEDVVLSPDTEFIYEEDDNLDYCYHVSKNIRDFVCIHQGGLIEYMFLAGEFHKSLKREFYKPKKNVKNIISKLNELSNYLNDSFKDAVGRSFDEIQKMYSGRHIKAPRVCLKSNLGSGDGKIIVLFREKTVNYDSDCNVNDNTGFKFIKENGVYYLCPNIPDSASKGEYVNPRLIKQDVVKYAKKLKSGKKVAENGSYLVDDDWIKCWRGTSGEDGTIVKQHYRNCYKSTLIIPLTLRNNRLGAKFTSKFKMKDVDRTIFGYLCFDHITVDYFDPVFDVDAGYIYADILSMYLLVRCIFLYQSKTYTDVITYLGDNRVNTDVF